MVILMNDLESHYALKKPIDRVESMLSIHGDLSIQQIHERYNKTWRSSITMPELTGLLRHKRFLKKGQTQVIGITGRKYASTVWGVVLI